MAGKCHSAIVEMARGALTLELCLLLTGSRSFPGGGQKCCSCSEAVREVHVNCMGSLVPEWSTGGGVELVKSDGMVSRQGGWRMTSIVGSMEVRTHALCLQGGQQFPSCMLVFGFSSFII